MAYCCVSVARMNEPVKRIANLIQADADEHTYLIVPESAINPGYTSEKVELLTPARFLTELDKHMAGLAFAEAAIRAEKEGFSAAILNAYGDYGIQTLRSVTRIPIVGAGQASIQAAMAFGKQFGIVTVWPPLTAPTYARLIAENGVESRYTGIRFVISDAELPGQLAKGSLGLTLRDAPETLIDRIEREARVLLDNGADVILIGCVCMCPIQPELERRLGVPVIDPLLAAHAHAEMLVRLGHQRATPPVADDRLEFLRAMLIGGSAQVATTGLSEDALCGDSCEILSAADTVGLTSV